MFAVCGVSLCLCFCSELVMWCELYVKCVFVFVQCACVVSLWCGVSYLLSVWCTCVVCSVPVRRAVFSVVSIGACVQ